MDASALVYICYFAKALAQAIIFFIWLADSTSETIQYIAAVVTLLAICPFSYVTTQALSTRPTLVFSATYFKAYLCFSAALGVLWFEPTRHGIRRIIPLSIVSILDTLSLLIFLYSKATARRSRPSVTDEEHGIDTLRNKALGRNDGDALAGDDEVQARIMRGARHSQDAENNTQVNSRESDEVRSFGGHAREPAGSGRVQGEQRRYRPHQVQQQQQEKYYQKYQGQRQEGNLYDLGVENQTHGNQSSLVRDKEAAALQKIQDDHQREEYEEFYGMQEEMAEIGGDGNVATRRIFRRPEVPYRIITTPAEQHPALRSRLSTSGRATPEPFETPRQEGSPQGEEENLEEGKL